jgi:Protein of unknown function (DUF3102)
VGSDVALAQHAEVIRALGKRVVHDVIEIGRRLTDAKARCGHGNWLPWLEREFGWSDSTALRYMQAHQFATDKSVTVTDLSLKSLYLLAAPSTPEAARGAAPGVSGEIDVSSGGSSMSILSAICSNRLATARNAPAKNLRSLAGRSARH